MNVKKKNRLIELEISMIEDEESYLTKLITKPHLLERIYYRTFIGANEILWYHTYFVKKDIKDAKQRMYNLGKLIDLQGKTEQTFQTHLGPRKELTALLLSDSKELLNCFKKWEFEDTFQWKKVIGFVPFIQKLLAGEHLLAKKEIEKYERHIESWLKDMQYEESHLFQFREDRAIMESMLAGDGAGIKRGIEYLVSEPVHRERNKWNEFEADFLSFPAVALLKVAWILGHKIEINSPYIPMELIPVRPLKKYKVPYFFMEGYEGELPESYKKWKAEQLEQSNKTTEAEKEYEYDKSKYGSAFEAGMIEDAKAKGHQVEKDEMGNYHIYDGAGQLLVSWKAGTI